MFAEVLLLSFAAYEKTSGVTAVKFGSALTSPSGHPYWDLLLPFHFPAPFCTLLLIVETMSLNCGYSGALK